MSDATVCAIPIAKGDTSEKRFWGYVNIQGRDECWEWTGSDAGRGYGKFSIKHVTYLAHRISWMLSNGSIPKGFHVCHSCDVPLCVNPKHLFLGTHRDNMADMVSKGRSAQGESQGASKLTDSLVSQILSEHDSGGVSQRKLAKKYGVSQTA